MDRKIAVVSPVGNEKDSIDEFMSDLSLVLQTLQCESMWFPVFDSYCEDGTIDIVKSQISRYPFINVIDIGEAQGISEAYLSGFQAALAWGADKIIEIDVGGHPVDLIPEFISLLNKVPVVYGTRTKYISIHRRLISRLGTIASWSILGMTMSDCTSGFEAFRRDLLEEILRKTFISRGHMFQTELKYYCKDIPFLEVPFVHTGSKTSLKNSEITEAMSILWSLRKIDPVQFSPVIHKKPPQSDKLSIYRDLSSSISDFLRRSLLFSGPREEMVTVLEYFKRLSNMEIDELSLEHNITQIKSLRPWFYPVVIGGIAVEPSEGGKNVGFSGDQLIHRTKYRQKILVDDLCSHYDFAGKSILDIGSNCGYWGAEYAKRGASSYIGIEGRETYCKQGELYWGANNFLPKSCYKFICADALKEDTWTMLKNMGQFDFCLCAGLMYHILEHKKLMNQILNITKEAVLIDTRVVLKRKHEKRHDIDGSFAALSTSEWIKIPLLSEIKEFLEEHDCKTVCLKTNDPFPSDSIGKEKDNYEKGNRVAILGIKKCRVNQ